MVKTKKGNKTTRYKRTKTKYGKELRLMETENYTFLFKKSDILLERSTGTFLDMNKKN